MSWQSFTYECGIQWLTDPQYPHTFGDNRLSILCWNAAFDRKVKHILCLFRGELVFHRLASLNLANLHREVDGSVSGSDVDNREVGIHSDVVL
jgi:hypothetical protein